MACGSCGGNHIGKCPGVECRCTNCGASFIAGNGWYNHSLCSHGCCAARRHQLAVQRAEIEEHDDYY